MKTDKLTYSLWKSARAPRINRAMKNASSGALKSGAVLGEEFLVRQDRIVGQLKRLAGIRAKIFSDGLLRQCLLETRREQQAPVLIKRNQILVKRRIVKPRQAQTVAHVQTLLDEFAPRQNMRCNQKLAHRKLRDAAPSTEIVQHRLTEIVLTTPLLHVRDNFCRPRRRNLANADSFLRQHDNFIRFIRVEQFAEGFFAGDRSLVQVRVIFVPHFAIECARADESFDSAQLQNGIERGEVAELHRNASRWAAHSFCKFDDGGLARLAREELGRLVGASGEPAFFRVKRWPRAIPQYTLGYQRFKDVMNAVEAAAPGLFVGGNCRDGISLANCIESGRRLAEAVTRPRVA